MNREYCVLLLVVTFLIDCYNYLSSVLFFSHNRLPPTFTFHFLDDANDVTNDRRMTGIATEQTIPSLSCPFPAIMLSNRRVTDVAHFQDVRLIEFDITGSNIE